MGMRLDKGCKDVLWSRVTPQRKYFEQMPQWTK